MLHPPGAIVHFSVKLCNQFSAGEEKKTPRGWWEKHFARTEKGGKKKNQREIGKNAAVAGGREYGTPEPDALGVKDAARGRAPGRYHSGAGQARKYLTVASASRADGRRHGGRRAASGPRCPPGPAPG